MLELTLANVRPYLHERGFAHVHSVAELAGGVSNVVFRVETDDLVFVLKQSRPQLRTAAPWFSDLSRIYREIDVMQALQPILPGVVPMVLFRDDDNYVFAMSHAPEPCRDWRSVLLAGEVEPELGHHAANILTAINLLRIKPTPEFERLRDKRVFNQLRIDPFYRRIVERCPDVAKPIRNLIQRLEDVSEGVCHGDFSPKNLLLHGGAFTLVDYETTHVGDPAFDWGFFMSHLVLKMIHLPEQWDNLLRTAQAFWSHLMFGEHAVAHLGACLLARVDGTSPAPYLKEETERELAHQLGRRYVRNDIMSPWDAVFDPLHDAWGPLRQRGLS